MSPAPAPFLSFTCPACQATLQAPPEAAGKTGHCKQCHLEVTIPVEFVDNPRPKRLHPSSVLLAEHPGPPAKHRRGSAHDESAEEPQARSRGLLIACAAIAPTTIWCVALVLLLGASRGAAETADPSAAAAADAASAPKEVLKKDVQGNVIERAIGDTPAEQKIWRYEYDQQGRLMKETNPLGIDTLFTYNADGRVGVVIQAEAGVVLHKTVVTYDANGIITGVTDNGTALELPEPPAWRDHDLYVGDRPVY
ncbi:MAG: RHS repeat protein [Planctomycetes bacterium]|nr:RHS repeat protein [Planctomycetota bacterium]